MFLFTHESLTKRSFLLILNIMKSHYIFVLPIFVIFTVIFLNLVFPSFSYAAKPRPKPAAIKTVSSNTFVSAKLRRDRLALNVYFANISKYSQISYTLTYTANGVEQGVQGSVSGGQNSQSRELLFGTCSKNVCTYHRGIQNMHLTVTAAKSDGTSVVKKFRIKP